MKVTSTETLKALRQAREQYGSWAEVIAHSKPDKDGVLRLPPTQEDDKNSPGQSPTRRTG
jgi:hypothetical protein